MLPTSALPGNTRITNVVAGFLMSWALAACPETEPPNPDTTADTTDIADTSDIIDTSDLGSADTTTPPPPVTPAACAFPGAVPVPQGTFVDHTIAAFPSTSCYFAFASPSLPFDPATPEGPFESTFDIKFTVAGFLDDDPQVVFYSNDFFRFHDEWYYYRLLNGQAVPRVNDVSVSGLAFPSIAAIYAALATAPQLPLDLVFIGATAGTFAGRLYSPRFYNLAGVAAPVPRRIFGLGSMLHFPPREGRVMPGRIHAFHLEYGENPTPATLAVYFDILRSALPAEIAADLRWLARSPAQEALALSLRASGGAWANRVLMFSDLAAPGAFEVYHPGITAGFIRIVGPGDPVDGLRPDEIAILARVPDDIPPVRAIVSDVPQTPLAHVALLAEARDTPNAWLSGVASDGRLAEWAWLRRPVMVSVSREGVQFKPITPTEYNTWLSRNQRFTPSLEPLEDPTDHPGAIDLDPAPLRRTDIALIGGKSAGLTSFHAGPEVPMPPYPLAITVRPYAVWFEPFSTMVQAVVDHASMDDLLFRFALLEGPTAFRAAFAKDSAALAHFERWLVNAGDDPLLGPILTADGLQKWLQKQPIPLDEFRPLRLALEARFAPLSPFQGLRFRSSSTVEDIPGFNGAGLYRSVTGFLEPQLQPGAGDRIRTIEAAIRDVWSSYWNYYAFNERASAGVDHFDGRMAITVHPRFDDALELANIVMTLSCNDHDLDGPCRLVINAQPGAMSVTNPGGGLALPEITVVSGIRDAEPTLTRVQGASSLEAGAILVTDAAALDMYTNARAHLQAWLAQDNAPLPAAERSRSLTLDYELKWMGAGWPRMADSSIAPQRFIWRQARVLDQPPRISPAADPWLGPTFPTTASLPVDLNPIARRLDVIRCRRDDLELRLYTITTLDDDRPAAPQPWVYKVWFRALLPWSGFDLPTQGFWLSHTAFSQDLASDGWTFAFNPTHAGILRLDSLAFDPVAPGVISLQRGQTQREATCATIEERALFTDASEYLRSLLAASVSRPR